MALTKLSCPHCGAVMKPARPIPEGKTVKCPKCDRPFKVGAEPPAGPPESAITSKGAARSPSGTSPKATAAKASDDEGGIYAVIKDEEVDAPKKKNRARMTRTRRRTTRTRRRKRKTPRPST